MSVTYTDAEMSISVTERGDFDRCRRQWDYTSPNRQSLLPRGMARTELQVGSAVHYATEAGALGFDPLEAVEAFYRVESQQIGVEYVAQVGAAMGAEERARLEKSRQLVLALVEQYFAKYGSDQIAPFKLVAPEISFRVPVPLEKYVNVDPEFPLAYHGPRLFLVGTFDGLACEVVRDISADGAPGRWDYDWSRIWLLERKTYSQKPEYKEWLLEDQIVGYEWAVQELFDVEVQGTLYDGINKKLPKEPAILRDGLVSKEWIDTTADTYVARLVEIHGPGWMSSIVKHVGEGTKKRPVSGQEWYGDVVSRLQARDAETQTPFHTRWKLPASQPAIRDWERAMVMQAITMADHPMVWPNRPWTGCWDCRVRDLCDAQTRGEDFQYLIDTRYRVGTYGTRLAQRDLTPAEVGSLQDVVKLIESKRAKVSAQIEGSKTE